MGIDGRAAECDGLLNHYTILNGIVGSNPTLSKLRGGMVYTSDLKSGASAYGFKSHRRHFR